MITKIGEAILAVIGAWTPGANIAANLLASVTALHRAVPDINLLGNAIVQEALTAEASLKAVENGDVAILGTVQVGGRSVAIFAIDNSSLLARKLFGT